MSLYALLSSNPLHLQLLGRNIMESSLNAGQQLLPLLDCLLKLLPSHLTLLLQVLQASSLQLCCGLLTWQKTININIIIILCNLYLHLM